MDDSLEHVLWVTTPNKREIHKENLLQLAQNFNKLTDSDRKLIPNFFDCGTTARAIFLSLVEYHRGELRFTKKEKDRLKQQYNSKTKGYINTKSIKETLANMKPGIMIISLKLERMELKK